MSAESTGGVDIVSETREEDLALSLEGDLLPTRAYQARAVSFLTNRIRTFHHLSVLRR